MKWLLLLTLSLIGPATALAAPPEVRGVCLPVGDDFLIPALTADTMRRVRDVGLNTVYVACWSDGYTTFPTDTLAKAIGVTHKINLPDPQPKTRDLLAEAIIEAHRNGLLHFGWFESGFAIASKESQHEWRRKQPRWLLRDKADSDVAPDGVVYLNPAHPDVRAFVIGIVTEAVTRYDLDGVAFDARFAWPDESMGRDDFTRELYMKDSGGSPVPDDPADADWLKWRTKKLKEFGGELIAAVRKTRPDVLVSVALPVQADWPADEFVGPIGDAAAANERKGKLVAGVVVDLERTTAWDDLERTLARVRDSGVAGHMFAPATGVLDNAAHLTQFYDVTNVGPARYPNRPADYRPPPAVGVKRGSHWQLRVSTPGTYSVIAKKNGVWQELARRRSSGGTIDIPDQKYEAVEMLRDRRSR